MLSIIPRQYQQRVNISFMANSNHISAEERGLLLEFRRGNIDLKKLKSINPKTNESLFHYAIKQNYINFVMYVLQKPSMCKELINFAPNKRSPLDYAISENMNKLIAKCGGKPFTALTEVIPAEDARVIAARTYVENPVRVAPAQIQEVPPQQQEKPAQKTVQPEAPKQVNYFDAFDEVDEINVDEPHNSMSQTTVKDNGETEKVLSKSESKTTGSATPKEKRKFELPKTYNNYPVLKVTEKDPKSVDEIIGMDRIKSELKENIIIPLNEQVANVTLKANAIDIPNGILLETGEDATSLVKALGSETNMPILQLFNPQELQPMLKDIETEYKSSGRKTIVLIRGFDKFFTTGANCDLEKKNFMLTSENCGDKGVLLFATADKKCDVDPKFLSSGVFDKVLELKIPDLKDRKEYLTQYFKDKILFKNLNTEEMIDEIGQKTEGFKYSDIENVLKESARSSVSNKQYEILPDTIRHELADFTSQNNICPVDEFNKTTMYDTPEFKRVPVERGEVMKLDDLGGMPEIKEKLKKLYIEPFRNLDKLREYLGSSAIPDGAIFYGPAGNGKTFTAKVLARELGLPFYETKLSDVASSFIHEVSRQIRQMAKQLNDKYAATGEMSVWFLDEFDSLGESRDGGNIASHKQEVTDTLLQEFNNPSSKGYILVAATNNLEGVDPALKRRGRLGNWIGFSNPEAEARIDIIRKNLAQTPFTQELSKDNEFLKMVEKEFDGSSVSSIVSVLTDAKREAILTGKDFHDCIKTCFDELNKRLMGEFCNKAGLKPHQYNEWDFQSLNQLGGMESVKKQLEENIIDVWHPEVRAALIANRRSLPGGVILEGPPGTGKTTIIETLARQMDVPLYKMNYSQKGNEFIHGVARNITDIFERLALESKIIKKPIILFFDEAEKFFPNFADRHQVEEVNTYKELMNTASAKGIILVGATNHIDMVNQEIIGNPRRMGTIIHCGNPDLNSRISLFNKILKDLPVLDSPLTGEQIEELARLSDGLSIGRIADIVDKQITQAVKKRLTIKPENLFKLFRG